MDRIVRRDAIIPGAAGRDPGVLPSILSVDGRTPARESISILEMGGCRGLCHEPRVALAVLESMLAPYCSGKQLTLLLRHKAVFASSEGDRVESITVQSLETGNLLVLHAPYIIDATEQGDLLPLTGTEYVTGAEAQSETGEAHAPETAQPQNMQSITWCFAMDYIDWGRPYD